MGLFDAFKKKSRNKICGVSMRRLKAVEGFVPVAQALGVQGLARCGLQ